MSLTEGRDKATEQATQRGQMVFIQGLIYLDQLTYEIAGILTKTRDTSFLEDWEAADIVSGLQGEPEEGRVRFRVEQALDRTKLLSTIRQKEVYRKLCSHLCLHDSSPKDMLADWVVANLST